MADIPIIFSGPMVRALLDGRKTMTRRLAWREPSDEFVEHVRAASAGVPSTIGRKPSPWQKVRPADRLWVKEDHYRTDNGDYETAVYAADEAAVARHINEVGNMASRGCLGDDWLKPHITLRRARYMPRWASRLTLTVTAVKVERLQDISEDDALAEGVRTIFGEYPPDHHLRQGPNKFSVDAGDYSLNSPTAAGAFSMLWEHLHGEDSWSPHTEVVAVSFTVAKANIDALSSLGEQEKKS